MNTSNAYFSEDQKFSPLSPAGDNRVLATFIEHTRRVALGVKKNKKSQKFLDTIRKIVHTICIVLLTPLCKHANRGGHFL